MLITFTGLIVNQKPIAYTASYWEPGTWHTLWKLSRIIIVIDIDLWISLSAF